MGWLILDLKMYKKLVIKFKKKSLDLQNIHFKMKSLFDGIKMNTQHYKNKKMEDIDFVKTQIWNTQKILSCKWTKTIVYNCFCDY